MHFDPQELIATAIDATGLDDLGATWDPAGLRALCTSLASEAQLDDTGRIALRARIVASITTRLRVVDWQARHRDTLRREVIADPIVVVGLFRAGTTYLSELLDQHPRLRSLLQWEAQDPVPPHGPNEHRRGPRVDAARAASAAATMVDPRFASIHHEEVDGPTECIAVLSQTFTSLLWESLANVPSYSEWLFGADQRAAYDYHRDVLRVLQSAGVRGRWTLKSPHHAIALDALTSALPGATLVLVHRDPLVLSASVCSLVTTLTGTFSRADHRAYITSHWPWILEESIRRVETFRAHRPEVTVVDIHYADLVRDPVGAVERITTAAGEALDGQTRLRLQAYVDTHPKGRFGTHRYDLASFGLDAGELRERFAGYVERHGIEPELPD